MKDRKLGPFQKRGHGSFSPRERLMTLILAGPVFAVGLPYLLIWGGKHCDQRFQLPPLPAQSVLTFLGALPLFTGFALAIWTIALQFTQGKGTPVPFVPTQKLLTWGPYAYCRNPMILGTISAHVGLSLWAGSLSALIFALLFGLLLSLYTKLVEEKELEDRFGEPYRLYKHQTPFLFPRLWKRRSDKS